MLPRVCSYIQEKKIYLLTMLSDEKFVWPMADPTELEMRFDDRNR